jgi:hypothetical protein
MCTPFTDKIVQIIFNDQRLGLLEPLLLPLLLLPEEEDEEEEELLLEEGV